MVEVGGALASGWISSSQKRETRGGRGRFISTILTCSSYNAEGPMVNTTVKAVARQRSKHNDLRAILHARGGLRAPCRGGGRGGRGTDLRGALGSGGRQG